MLLHRTEFERTHAASILLTHACLIRRVLGDTAVRTAPYCLSYVSPESDVRCEQLAPLHNDAELNRQF